MKSLRPAIVMSDEAYTKWIESITEQAIVCMLQEFHPAKENALDIDKEYWQYSYFSIQRNKDGSLFGIDYTYDQKPLKSDGRCCYWGSQKSDDSSGLWGDVFTARIVPLFHEILPELRWNDIRGLNNRHIFIETDIPLYETNWCGDRVFLFSDRRDHPRSETNLKKKFLGYSKKVNEGTLLTLFPGHREDIYDFEKWWKGNSSDYPDFRYLYSEPLRR
jgi:hypothetical protein